MLQALNEDSGKMEAPTPVLSQSSIATNDDAIEGILREGYEHPQQAVKRD